MTSSMPIRIAGVALALSFSVATIAAEPATSEQEEAKKLAQQLSNPIANLVSIPAQFNWYEGVGVDDDLRFVLNLQPVVPFSITKDWNLIGRFILPFLSQPPLVPGADTTFGTGDIVASAFFSPKVSRVVWGVGPVFGIPTTSDPALGSGKWSIGPTAVVLKQEHHWTYGALVNQLWSYASTGDVSRESVNQTYLQPFGAYTFDNALTLTLSSESTANWKASTGQQWTIPVIGQVSKVTRLGPFPFSIGGGLGYFLESPDGGPQWMLRMNFVLILPTKRG